ncbi:hypothetical protein [Lentibacillus sp.]|jgi:hypothetical protein|nr:hypothetical protein [Lentibacillus sp.]HLS07464.1 hypothetical protein [Lentibacillus sp.]
MKKLMATVTFGTLLVVGITAVQDNPSDTAIEVEPTVLSIGPDVSLF